LKKYKTTNFNIAINVSFLIMSCFISCFVSSPPEHTVSEIVLKFGETNQELAEFQNSILFNHPLALKTAEVVRNFLLKCSDSDLKSYLCLHMWKTEGNKDKASQIIIENFRKQFEILDLSSLGLTDLPGCIFSPIFNFTSLVCSNNELSYFPTTLKQGSNIKKIDCHSNQMEEIPDEIHGCPNLEELNCSYNKIFYVSSAIVSCTRLKILSCAGNLPIEFPNVIWKLPHDCFIDVTDTGFLPIIFYKVMEVQKQQNYKGPKFIFPPPPKPLHKRIVELRNPKNIIEK